MIVVYLSQINIFFLFFFLLTSARKRRAGSNSSNIELLVLCSVQLILNILLYMSISNAFRLLFCVSRVYTNNNQVSKNITQMVTSMTDTDSSVCP